MKKYIISAAICILFFTDQIISNAQGIFLTATDQRSGKIEGDVLQKGFEKKIELLSYQFEENITSSKKLRSLLKITKKFDTSTTKFFSAMATNSPIRQFEIEVFIANREGVVIKTLTIELFDVSVIGFRNFKEKPETAIIDEITFGYSKIKMTNVPKNSIAEYSIKSND